MSRSSRSPNRSRRLSTFVSQKFSPFELLENRTMMCMWHGDPGLPEPLQGPVVTVPAETGHDTRRRRRRRHHLDQPFDHHDRRDGR
jgi:hypothetical protein